MKEVCALTARVPTSDARVLITGETGAGKGLLAHYIHARSARARRPFIPAPATEQSEAKTFRGWGLREHDSTRLY